MQISCCRRLKFEGAHRLYPCESKCQNWHGHSYKVLVYAKNKHGLNSNGMVVDFSELKKGLGEWIDENWDHALIYNEEDLITSTMLKSNPSSKSFIMPYNPTAENMCSYLLNVVCPQIYKDADFEVFKIQVYETEDCFAEATLVV